MMTPNQLGQGKQPTTVVTNQLSLYEDNDPIANPEILFF